MEILVIVIVLLLAAGFIVFRRKPAVSGPGNAVSRGAASPAKARSGKVRAANAGPRNPYRATSICVDDHACDRAKALSNRRFLDIERNTPVLPLAGCDAAQCNCRYARHEDRRDDHEDRRNPNALKSELYDQSGNQNRRARRRGRRKTDWA